MDITSTLAGLAGLLIVVALIGAGVWAINLWEARHEHDKDRNATAH